MSGFGRIVSLGAIVATVAGIAGLRAQTQLADPKDAPKIFASTCSACHKSPQGLAKSGQVAGFLRQHYTTGPEMSAAMAAYLVAAGSGPAKKDKDREKAAAAGEKSKSKKQEQAAAHPGQDAKELAKERTTLRGKQLSKSHEERAQPAHPSPASATEAATRQAADPAPRQAAVSVPSPAVAENPPAPAAETTPPPVVFNIPLPDMPTTPPADLTQSAFSSSPLP